MSVITINPSAHSGTNTITIVGSHQVNLTSGVVTQGGTTVATLNAQGRSDYQDKIYYVANGSYTVIQ